MEIDMVLDRVRVLNDEARMYLTDGLAVVTPGVSALSEDDQGEIWERVRTFDEFAPDSDPWDEHAFGAFECSGRRVCWRIEYFDRHGGACGSPDPADAYLTRRVLKIMLAGEY
jgi:hypothetical protein